MATTNKVALALQRSEAIQDEELARQTETRTHPSHVTTAGLFTVTSKSKYETPAPTKKAPRNWEVTSEWAGKRVDFRGRDELNPFDALVLMTFGVFANSTRMVATSTTTDPETRASRDNMFERQLDMFEDTQPVIAEAKFSRYQFVKMVVGHTPGGDDYKRVDDSIEKFEDVKIKVWDATNSYVEYSSHMITGWARGGQKGDMQRVFLNPLITASLFHIDGAPYARLRVAEARELSGPTRLLYLMLCSRAQGPKPIPFKLDALVLHVYPDFDGTNRHKRTTIRAALREIGKLNGWTVEEKTNNIWHIGRARSPNNLTKTDDLLL